MNDKWTSLSLAAAGALLSIVAVCGPAKAESGQITLACTQINVLPQNAETVYLVLNYDDNTIHWGPLDAGMWVKGNFGEDEVSWSATHLSCPNKKTGDYGHDCLWWGKLNRSDGSYTEYREPIHPNTKFYQCEKSETKPPTGRKF